MDLFRAGYAVFRQIKEGGLDYRAMSLVYTSLLALIPLLAVSFAMLKAFGADAYLEPLLLQLLDPLGENKASIAATMLDSVRRLDVGVLGSVGLLSLLYTSVSLLDKIEESVNHIWRRQAKFSRSLVRRFSDYLTFILVGPLLVFSAFGGMSELFHRVNNHPWLDDGISLFVPVFQSTLPYLFIIAAFAFLYKLIPDAPVKLRSALFGGAIAGMAWKLVGWVFASFMAGSAQYHAVYSTFAILVLFMVWLYMSWLVVLLGVQVTFFHQYPRYMALRSRQPRLSGRVAERLGLLALVLVGRRFFRGEPPWLAHDLALRLEVPDDCVDDIVSVFIGKGYIMAVGRDADGVIPARDFSTLTVLEVLDAIRSAHEDDFPLSLDALAEPGLDAVLGRCDTGIREAAGGLTLRDLALAEDS
ncbi:MAG: YihY/virulence factor BrkB family protein [Candidatus Methylumidiphilus sp.]